MQSTTPLNPHRRMPSWFFSSLFTGVSPLGHYLRTGRFACPERAASSPLSRVRAGDCFAAFLAYYGFPPVAALGQVLDDAGSKSTSLGSGGKRANKAPSIARMARAMPGTPMAVLLAVRRELRAGAAL